MQALTNLLLKVVYLLPDGIRSQLAIDKWLHLFMGVLIGFVVGGGALFLGFSPWIGAAAATILGAAKEVRDFMINKEAAKNGLPPPHGVEVLDFLFTGAGGALAALVLVFVLGL